MQKFLLKSAVLLFLPAVFFSCKKNKTDTTVVKEWSLNLSAKNENPAPASRAESGLATIKLMSDNSITYNFNVTGLASTDALTAAHFHSGNAGANGSVILNFNPSFSGTASSGTILNVRQSLVDSLKNDANEIYFNVHSNQVASGLVRAQINTKVELAMDIMLSGANEVPAVNTSATGMAQLRLTADKKLYSVITVSNLAAGDALLFAHLHNGAVGVNGAIVLGIAGSASDFAVNKVYALTDAIYNSIKSDAMYVNAHSTLYAGGVVRGQIR
ncbi:CHRD domain-containing protein [Lacibacter sp.]|uniref:CHRD domain-containing protein n=1 Tax=Lacibacter sp. TaxID=1915409 RepID=UPI002B4AC7EF|nr:CHRD domain-containing protein [Lacibacter sp.]HLP38399.1 CHRD domain-containing protein [Lacibacter sp.]